MTETFSSEGARFVYEVWCDKCGFVSTDPELLECPVDHRFLRERLRQVVGPGRAA